MNKKSGVSFQDLSKFSEVVGSVRLRGVDVQLCDYVECMDNNRWYAAAHYDFETGNTSPEYLKKIGIKVKKLTSGYGDCVREFHIAYVPENLLSEAKPQYNDSHMTEDLIKRLRSHLAKLNTQKETEAQITSIA